MSSDEDDDEALIVPAERYAPRRGLRHQRLSDRERSIRMFGRVAPLDRLEVLAAPAAAAAAVRDRPPHPFPRRLTLRSPRHLSDPDEGVVIVDDPPTHQANNRSTTMRRRDSNSEEPPPKRLRGMDPDLTVRVGNQEFHAYSQSLRQASEYIDTMLSTKMKEGETNVIEFPDKDPAEWKVVYKFLEPSTARFAHITEGNVRFLIKWFHEFGLTEHLNECDDFIRRQVPWLYNLRHGSEQLDSLVDYLHCSETYGLAKAKEKILGVLQRSLETKLDFYASIENMTQILSLVNNEEYRDRLWPAIKPHLPEEIREMNMNGLMQNPLFVHMLSFKAQLLKNDRNPPLVPRGAPPVARP